MRISQLYNDCDGQCLDCPESDFMEKYESGKPWKACRFSCRRFGFDRGTFKYSDLSEEQMREKLRKYFILKGEF